MPKKTHNKPVEEPINYRVTYACSQCTRSGMKLWRDYNTFQNRLELKCATCLTPAQVLYEKKHYSAQNREHLGALDPDGLFMFRSGDQLGGLVPAVPTPEGDTFWGYSSVPNEDVLWWYALPTYQDDERELRCLRQLIDRTKDAYMGARSLVLRLRGRVDGASRQLRYRVEQPGPLPQITTDELNATAPVVSTEPTVLRKHLLRMMSVNSDLDKMTIDLYRQADDLEWKIERRLFEFTQPTKVLIYDTEITESENLRVYAQVERYRDVGRDDRVAVTEDHNGRAFLLDPSDDSLRKARVIMEHNQDVARWVHEQVLAGNLREVQRCS